MGIYWFEILARIGPMLPVRFESFPLLGLLKWFKFPSKEFLDIQASLCIPIGRQIRHIRFSLMGFILEITKHLYQSSQLIKQEGILIRKALLPCLLSY